MKMTQKKAIRIAKEVLVPVHSQHNTFYIKISKVDANWLIDRDGENFEISLSEDGSCSIEARHRSIGESAYEPVVGDVEKFILGAKYGC